MKAIKWIVLWVGSFAFTSALDAAWHLLLFGKQYAAGLRPVARMRGDKFAFHPAAGLFSQILVVSTILFLVVWNVKGDDYHAALLVGMAAGILAISVYGVTNFALLREWNVAITLLEMVWGPLLGGISALFMLFLKTKLFR